MKCVLALTFDKQQLYIKYFFVTFAKFGVIWANTEGMRRGYIEESGIMKWLITACDAVLAVLCMVLTYNYFQENDPEINNGVDLQLYWITVVFSYVLLTIYMPPILLRRVVRIDKIVERSAHKVVLLALMVTSFLFILKNVAIARVLLATFFVLFFVVLTIERLIMRYLVRMFRRSGRNQQNVILVGRSDELSELNDYMQNREYGYRVYATFAEGDVELPGDFEHQGGIDSVIPYLSDHPHINAVYCTMSYDSKDEIMAIYRYCENHVIRFYALPMYLRSLRKNMTMSRIESTIVLSPRPEPLQDLGNRIVKRMFDLLVSLLFLLTLYPIIYLIVFCIIKIQSPGPVYFTQKRSGLNGRDFVCYKFRSMHINADSDRAQATEHDPRKFPFGDFMRRTNIDELPQFLNVLKGDMSVVGPRPHMLLHTEEYSRLVNKYMVRHWVKPGITGWAQVNGFRGETRDLIQMEERVKHDIWYIENWTFWLDVRIVWRTLWNMVMRKDKNAY